MKGIAFTFDDDVSSHYEVVAPMFERYGLKCTFFINGNKLNLWKKTKDHNGHCYDLSDIEDEQILDLYKRGFEIGNHTFNHIHIANASLVKLTDEFRKTEDKLSDLGIDIAPVFSYPGYAINRDRLDVMNLISELGYKLGRVGYFDEGRGFNFNLDNNPQNWDRDESHYYTPKETNPFFVKCCAMFCDNLTFDMFNRSVHEAPEDSYCVLNGHVFTLKSQIKKLEEVCKYCADNDLRTLHFSELPL